MPIDYDLLKLELGREEELNKINITLIPRIKATIEAQKSTGIAGGV